MVASNVGMLEGTGGPMDWFNQLPKVTKGYATLCVFTAACLSWNIPGIEYALLDWTKVYKSFQARTARLSMEVTCTPSAWGVATCGNSAHTTHTSHNSLQFF
jgi:hypothetical protein